LQLESHEPKKTRSRVDVFAFGVMIFAIIYFSGQLIRYWFW